MLKTEAAHGKCYLGKYFKAVQTLAASILSTPHPLSSGSGDDEEPRLPGIKKNQSEAWKLNQQRA